MTDTERRHRIMRDIALVERNAKLLQTAQDYLDEAMKAGVNDPGALLMGLPLTIPQAAYFHNRGYKEGYAAGLQDMRNAMEQAVQWSKTQ